MLSNKMLVWIGMSWGQMEGSPWCYVILQMRKASFWDMQWFTVIDTDSELQVVLGSWPTETLSKIKVELTGG